MLALPLVGCGWLATVVLSSRDVERAGDAVAAVLSESHPRCTRRQYDASQHRHGTPDQRAAATETLPTASQHADRDALGLAALDARPVDGRVGLSVHLACKERGGLQARVRTTRCESVEGRASWGPEPVSRVPHTRGFKQQRVDHLKAGPLHTPTTG